MTKNILLLGGTGFVGRKLAQRLAGQHIVHIIAHTADKLPRMDDVYCYPGSLGDSDLLRRVLPCCQIVFHVASDTTPGVSAFLPAFEAEHNLLPTLSFLEVLQDYPDAFLIYLSTGGAIYGNSPEFLVTETTPLLPLSYYGAGKAAIEKFIIAFCHQTGHPALILRPSNFYGPGQPYRPGFGIVPTIFYHLRKKMALPVWGDGENIRDYLFIDDFINLCMILIDKTLEVRSRKDINIYNTGYGRGYSLNQLFNIVQNVTGLELRREYHPIRKIDVSQIVLNCGRLRADFGWQAETDLMRGIELIWQVLRCGELGD